MRQEGDEEEPSHLYGVQLKDFPSAKILHPTAEELIPPAIDSIGKKVLAPRDLWSLKN